jgi:hypothetical protein
MASALVVFIVIVRKGRRFERICIALHGRWGMADDTKDTTSGTLGIGPYYEF